jgi:glycosyltransferase involved in cell wall biosynthesis
VSSNAVSNGSAIAARSRPRLVVALTFSVHPAMGGGQVRARQLYGALSAVYDIELVSLVGTDEPAHRRQLDAALWETTVPKSSEHASAEIELERAVGTVVTDIAMSDLHVLTPEYGRALQRLAAGARAVVACHPFTFPAIRAASSAPVWYEAQDVEAELKRHVLGAGEPAQQLLRRAEEVERGCCVDAELVWACSEEDRSKLVARYAVDAAKVLVVPNGATLDEASFVSAQLREQRRRRLRIDDRPLGVFVASWHEPNVVGARALLRLAEQMPEAEFMIIGSVGLALANDRRPDNVQCPGVVSLAFKQTVLGIADAALNPVTTGSGTNLKMLDYFSAGIPVISTEFGARGLGVQPGTHYLQAEPQGFPRALTALRGLDLEARARMVDDARRHVEQRMSWEVVSAELLQALDGPGISPRA